jgi:hypothetical protein
VQGTGLVKGEQVKPLWRPAAPWDHVRAVVWA